MAQRYLAFVEIEANRENLTMILSEESVYKFIATTIAIQAVSAFMFFRSIPPEYAETFYTLKTGNQFSLDTFFDNKDSEERDGSRDQFRLMVFADSKVRWSGIEPEVREWVNRMIPIWNDHQPEWWNDQKKSMVPDWIVNDPALLLSIRGHGVQMLQERRGSWANVTGPELEALQRRGSRAITVEPPPQKNNIENL